MYKEVSGSIRRTRTAEARKTIFRAEKPNTVLLSGFTANGYQGKPGCLPHLERNALEREVGPAAY